MREGCFHAERVFRTVGSGSNAAHSSLAASWRRSMEHYGLDPARDGAPDRIETRELVRRREELGQLLALASPRLDQLSALVAASGCGVLLTDSAGIVLDRRCADADADTFRDWGLHPGADWSEAHEGTNGIGTCLAEKRRVTIHRGDHFLARNTALSCMDAPIFGSDGHIIAALDVSSARVDETEGFNRLLAAAVSQFAKVIEAANFKAAYPGARIVVGDSAGGEAAVLLAIDADDLVIGATRSARRVFALEPTGAIAPRPAADLFGAAEEAGGFEKAERSTVIRALARANGNASQAARALGIARATLYRRMQRLGIQK